MLQHPRSAPRRGGAARCKQVWSYRWIIALGVLAPALPFLLWSCNSHPLERPDRQPLGEAVQYREVSPVKNVDILFVVDNSGSMSEEQGNLTRNFRAFMDVLATIPGADLHIASVNSDLGAGVVTNSTACLPTPGGDRGVFCSVKGVDRCGGACGVDVTNGRFIRTVPPNFAGAIQDRFACMATYGTNGCGFEHTLGSLRSALTAPENAGFIRDDAYLAFVVITDEDDCTAPADSQMFAADNPGQDTSLRCALAGHVCNGQHNTGAQAVDLPLSACSAAPDGGLVPIPELVNAVLDIKKDPNRVIAAGIFGWPLPGQEAGARYEIERGGGGGGGAFSLQPVCSSTGNGSATSAYRVKSFVESFPNNSVFSICQNDFSAAMRQIGEKIRTIVGPACVTAPLIDTNLATTAMDPDCNVVERVPRPGVSGQWNETLVPRCPTGATQPCWDLVPDPTCTASGQQILIDRKGTTPAEGTQQVFRCLTCPSRSTPGECNPKPVQMP